MARAPSLKHIWEPWWKCLGYPGTFNPRALLNFRHPSTIGELLDTNFWYFPRLLEEGVHRNRGAALWASPTWTRIASGDLGEINVMGDLFDTATLTPRTDLGCNAVERRQGRSAIDTLIKGLPISWQTLLDTARNDGSDRVWTPPMDRIPARQSFQHCGVFTNFREGRYGLITDTIGRWIPLEDMYYKYIYKVVTHSKDDPRALRTRVADVRLEMTRKLCRTVRTVELWKSVYDKDIARYRLPKANDLLYRLLLGVVECGPELHWLDDNAQRCPMDGELQTVEHIWVHCKVADEVWGAFERIYWRLSSAAP